MFYFYLPFGLSGVTQYYVGIIADAIRLLGYEINTVDNLKSIPEKANVLTIRDKDTTYVIGRRNPQYVITWFQGVAPEEMDLLYKGRWDRIPRVLIHRIFERYALKHSSLSLFVSNAMNEHYADRYHYSGSNHIIMPCFGNDLDLTSFTDLRYQEPKFLYSGSITKWQCVEDMLVLFKRIKSEIPQATLSILTPDRDIAYKMLEQHGVTASVDFISPDRLQDYIRQFKYGFIVRDDIAINQVATPTKMSNYMGAGIIPVYSDVVKDYKEHITSKTPYIIAFNDFDECISKIKEMEKRQISAELIAGSYSEIFRDYWNRESYTKLISQKIKETIRQS